MTKEHTEHRWAITTSTGRQSFFGRYTWPASLQDSDTQVRTFTTREEARRAMKDCDYDKRSKVVKVIVKTTVVEKT